MIAAPQRRQLQIRQPNGEWVLADIVALEPGDVFCLVEPNGEPVENRSGHAIFRATGYPGVPCEPVDA